MKFQKSMICVTIASDNITPEAGSTTENITISDAHITSSQPPQPSSPIRLTSTKQVNAPNWQATRPITFPPLHPVMDPLMQAWAAMDQINSSLNDKAENKFGLNRKRTAMEAGFIDEDKDELSHEEEVEGDDAGYDNIG